MSYFSNSPLSSSPLTPIASPTAPLGPGHVFFTPSPSPSFPSSSSSTSSSSSSKQGMPPQQAAHKPYSPSDLLHSASSSSSSPPSSSSVLEGTAAAAGFGGKFGQNESENAYLNNSGGHVSPQSPSSSSSSSSSTSLGSANNHSGNNHHHHHHHHHVHSNLGNMGNVASAHMATSWNIGLRRLMQYVGDPVNMKFLAVCSLWYVCSSLTNNTDKIILNTLPFPATLTYFQFVLAVPFSLLFAPLIGFSTLVQPSLSVIKIALPFCIFRILGHVSASVSLWLVPVSYSHTVKALGPLFSVFLSKVILGTSFSNLTYLSLVPLISGVILATATEINFNVVGTVAALFSVFVLSLQSIYSKKLFVSQALDEANLLFHTSLLSALALTPYWLVFEAGEIDWSEMTVSTSLFVLFNGLTQYGQCICAFSVVALTSPVTYSIASLFKRVFVIVLALLWFGNPVSFWNLLGIMTTFFGLYLYQKSRISDHKLQGKDRSYSPNGITSTSSDMLIRSSSSVFGSAKDRLPTHTTQGRVGFN